MRRELREKRILITGASQGIGQALAIEAVAAGARVAISARSEDLLRKAAEDLTGHGHPVLAIPADVTKSDDRRRMLDSVIQAWGGLDVLVNNAGVSCFGHFSSSTEEVLREVMEVNFFGPAELIRLAIPVLAQGDQPAVVNVSSRCGRRALPAFPEYSASKFALCGLTEALRAEFVRQGIDVLLIVPGYVATGLPERMLRREGKIDLCKLRGISPRQAALEILDAIRKNRAETVLGGDARWLLRFNRFFPRLTNYLIARKVKKLYSGVRSQSEGVGSRD
jgi:short-subunit dehydrogenase